MIQYQNGNSTVELHEDGTRVIQFEDKLKLNYPLNIDIRVNKGCSLGYNPTLKVAVCEFCHESATIDGKECDYEPLKEKLKGLPKGIELAIGGNKVTDELCEFLFWCKNQGYVCNLTVNQLHIKQYGEKLKDMMTIGIIKGLGISYRKDYSVDRMDRYFFNHPNVILHVIAGIDDVDDIISLPFKKILVLGYKTFGFGVKYYSDTVKQNIQEWVWWVRKLIENKDVVSFDNLALEQLKVRRFISDEHWEVFNQGEHSFYINAVDGYFSPSSRNPKKVDWNTMSVKEYFNLLDDENKLCH